MVWNNWYCASIIDFFHCIWYLVSGNFESIAAPPFECLFVLRLLWNGPWWFANLWLLQLVGWGTSRFFEKFWPNFYLVFCCLQRLLHVMVGHSCRREALANNLLGVRTSFQKCLGKKANPLFFYDQNSNANYVLLSDQKIDICKQILGQKNS